MPPQSSKELLGEASEEYEEQLIGSQAEEYLVNQRGLSMDVLRSSRVGFVSHPMTGDDFFKGMISFPFVTPSGVVAIQFRAVGTPKSGKRFLNRGSTKRLYNVSALREPHRKIYLCEGPVDTMTVAMLGLPAVGVPGVSNWERWFGRVFRNRVVVVCADGDDKANQGENFARRVQVDVDESAVILFDGEDVNSFYTKHGESRLREKLGG